MCACISRSVMELRSRLEARYGMDAETMLAQPATKIFPRTDESRAACMLRRSTVRQNVISPKVTVSSYLKIGRNVRYDANDVQSYLAVCGVSVSDPHERRQNR